MAAVVSDMSQPLGRAIGNALEVGEALDTLDGSRPSQTSPSFRDGAGAADRRAGHQRRTRPRDVEAVPCSAGAGLRTCGAWSKPRVATRRRLTIVPAARGPTAAGRGRRDDGYIERIDALDVARASTLLGAGRERKGEPIDLAVGVVLEAKWATG